jgi:y4mF family transcriptional regulator
MSVSQSVSSATREQAVLSEILSGGRSTLPSITVDRPSAVSVTAVADLGALIRQARTRLGFSQQRFADLAGVGRRFVSELEAGKPSLEAERVLRCCLAAGIDIVARPRQP